MKKRFVSIWIMLMAGAGVSQAQQLPVIRETSFRKDTVLITAFGAKSDGSTLCTKAINKAIDAVAAKGGGVVVIPAGLWISGPVTLKSNVNLHLQYNALLQFTSDFNQYPLVEGNWEGLPQMRNQSPISATGQENIALTGKGIIDGGGDAWRMVKREKLTESQWKSLVASGGMLSEDKRTWYPSVQSYKGSLLKNPGAIEPGKDAAFYNNVKDFLRPNLLVLTNCKRILLEGLIIQNSPAWCLHPLMSEDIVVRSITVRTPWYAQNGDGIDVESCKNVLIENSVFDVGDDALCMKSGRDEAGRKRGIPTQDMIIRNCVVYHAHGGFVVGSEMSGGVRNIHVSNCTFIGTDIGLRFKSTRGRGGLVENIFIDQIVMRDIVGEAILFDMYYMAKDPVPLSGEKRETPRAELLPVNEGTPEFRNISISNVVVNGAPKAIFLRGLPEMPVKNITLRNMRFVTDIYLEAVDTTGIRLENIQWQSSRNAANTWGEKLSQTAMRIWPDSFALEGDKTAKWRYDLGVILKGMEAVWKQNKQQEYFNYIKKMMDFYVDQNGKIKGYKKDEFNIDHVNNGKNLLFLYEETGSEKYRKAADLLRDQLRHHPRTRSGGFWHKEIYPWQMWLDGLYMGQPFYAQYAKLFNEPEAFNDITRQFVLMEQYARDKKTGLLYHGWDESREQRWANKKTGQSPHFWGRALGWYGMAMVDALDYFPASHPGRDSIIGILNRYAKAVVNYQDAGSGTWWDVVDKKNVPGNYHESSASSMIVYALAKGIRMKYLPASYGKAVQKGFDGIINEFIEKDTNGGFNLKGTVAVSGLGGNPYRDGSFEYYIKEPVITNDPKGMGAFIKCAAEMELMRQTGGKP